MMAGMGSEDDVGFVKKQVGILTDKKHVEKS
jgi:hypothetical protein